MTAEKYGDKFRLRKLKGFCELQLDNGITSYAPQPDARQREVDRVERLTLLKMREKAREVTGLGSISPDSLGDFQTSNRHMLEGSRLARFYTKINYSVMDNDEADLTDLPGFIRQVSNEAVLDSGVLDRMVQVASTNAESNFLYAANQNKLFFITVFKADTYQVIVRSYAVEEGGLPAGAFLTSTGSWNIERHGAGSKMSQWNLMEEFKPMN